MILKKKRLWQLSFAMSLLLLFLACSKQDVIRPNIKNKLASLDSITQTQTEDFFLELDSLLQNSKDLTSLERAMLLFKKGEFLYINFKYQEAFNTHLKCYKLFVELNDIYNQGRSLITLSGASLHMGDVETSQIYALKALHLAKLIEDKRIEGKAYNQLFNLHYKLKDYSKALSYINVTDSLFSKGIDTASIISIKNNKASVYLQLKEYNKALNRFHIAAKIAKEEIILFLIITSIFIFLASAGIYFFENEAQPEVFTSVIHSGWWAIVTLTTVGYGDVYPITTGGKIFTFFTLLIGVGIVTIPAGLIASALSKARDIEEQNNKKE